jgi:hypothetical protein
VVYRSLKTSRIIPRPKACPSSGGADADHISAEERYDVMNMVTTKEIQVVSKKATS